MVTICLAQGFSVHYLLQFICFFFFFFHFNVFLPLNCTYILPTFLGPPRLLFFPYLSLGRTICIIQISYLLPVDLRFLTTPPTLIPNFQLLLITFLICLSFSALLYSPFFSKLIINYSQIFLRPWFPHLLVTL